MNASVESMRAQRRGISTSLHWYHWLVLGLSLLLTFGAWYVTSEQAKEKSQTQFEFQSNQILELVSERMAKYEEALWAGVAALHLHDKTTSRDEWRIFAESLKIEERFPGINGIGVIHYVPEDKFDLYLEWQRETYADYKTHPSHENSDNYPITYIEPENINLKAIGLDMAHENNRYNGAKRARVSGEATITGPITLVQDSQKTPGFLFYAPLYSRNGVPDEYGSNEDGFLGLVYAPFIMHRLMDGTLSNTNRQVNFSIHDENYELYNELNDKSQNFDPNPMFSETKTLDIYGRTWTFNLQSSLLFREQQTQSKPVFILVGGIFIDLLLLIIFVLISRSKDRAVDYANEVTVDLRVRQKELERAREKLEERNKELEEANTELDQFAFVASHDLKAPLRGIAQLVQWTSEDLNGQLTEQTSNYLNLLKNRVNRLESLLDDLLAYSRVGRKEERTEDVDIKDKVESIFEILSPPEGFHLTCSTEVEKVKTVSSPLEQVIRNLISNAIKHHDKSSGKINVNVEEIPGGCRFSVMDDGPGIPPEYQKRVFELFHTLKPRDSVEGSGMGLSIIRKILDRYDSEYRIESDGKRNCTFIFTWPEIEPE